MSVPGLGDNFETKTQSACISYVSENKFDAPVSAIAEVYSHVVTIRYFLVPYNLSFMKYAIHMEKMIRIRAICFLCIMLP